MGRQGDGFTKGSRVSYLHTVYTWYMLSVKGPG